MKYICLLSAISVLFFSSCNNDSDKPDYDVIFTIIEPEEGGVYTSGQEFHIEADVEGTLPIENIEMILHNMTTGDTLWYYSTTTSQDFYAFHDHPILAVAGASECHFEISAWQYAYADRITKEVHFEINP